ncbi:MAG TPA: extracellular solute-binding protein [candidate division Zixibacteria bacterium]|nr:extracellular solute-binding protein [candidate division Zixibacteria bacterium]
MGSTEEFTARWTSTERRPRPGQSGRNNVGPRSPRAGELVNGFCALILAVTCSSAAWAQGGRPAKAADLAAYDRPDREQVLYAGARNEGKVTWYTSLAGGSYKELAATFEKKYPGVKVEAYRATSQELTARVVTESQARRFIVDTIESTIPLLRFMLDNRLLLPYFSPPLSRYPDFSKQPAARKGLVYWAIDRESHIVLSYNKKSIPADAVPKNYEGLLNPRLKDKIGLAGSDTGTRTIGAMLKFKGEEFLQRLKAQNPAIHNVSGRALLDMVISGEVGLSPTTFRNHAEVSIAEGAPIAWVPMDVVPTNSGSTAVAAQPPHPHAALLFADFILGADGQKVLAKYQYGNPTQDYGFKRWYPDQEGRTTEEYEKLDARWEKLLRELGRK